MNRVIPSEVEEPPHDRKIAPRDPSTPLRSAQDDKRCLSLDLGQFFQIDVLDPLPQFAGLLVL